MRVRTPCLVAVLAVLELQAAGLAQWVNVAPGIDYRAMDLPGPVKVYIARADRSRDTWTLDTMTSQGTVKGGRETVPAMAARYDDTVTWDGRRYEVKVAINGDFFNMSTGYSLGGQVIGGWYVKRYRDWGGMSGFFWTRERRAGIGGDVLNGPKLQSIIFADGSEMRINALNDRRGKDELALYTSHWDRTTGTDRDGAEVLVRMDEPIAVNPEGPGNRGVIDKVANGAGSMAIPFDCVVLSAAGTAAPRLLQHARVGEAVHFKMRIRDLGVERIRLEPAKWHKVWASIGDTQNLLVGGTIPKHWEAKAAKLAAEGKKHGSVVRDPRTAIAFSKGYVFFLVVDGRSRESIGMTYTEVAEFCRDTLRVDYAVMQDGGGSSTLWVDGQVKNTPSGKGKNEKRGVLRAVANGYLMAVVHPAQGSDRYKAGSPIKTRKETELRLGPGSQYGAAGKVDEGTVGRVLSHRLDGVQAKGAKWWLVQFESGQGWLPEEMLKAR